MVCHNRGLRTVAEKALDYYKENPWEKHWFKKFLNDEDDEVAWAGFKLFLKCVDRRYWLWNNDFLDDFHNDGRKQKRFEILVTKSGMKLKKHEENERNEVKLSWEKNCSKIKHGHG